MIQLKYRFKIPRYWCGIYFKIAFKKREGTKVIGITNKVGHRYVIFLDYDYDEINSITQEIQSLQEKYALGNAYLFKTKKGYHVIFLDIVNYNELRTIINDTSCDDAYKTIPQHNNARTWVLRITEKHDNRIDYERVIEAQQYRPTSEPHTRLLRIRGVPEKTLRKNIPYEEGREQELIYATYEA